MYQILVLCFLCCLCQHLSAQFQPRTLSEEYSQCTAAKIEGIQTWKDLLERNDITLKDKLSYVKVSLSKGRFEEALEIGQAIEDKVLYIEEDLVVLDEMMGDVYYYNGKLTEAALAYQMAMRYNRSTLEIYYKLAATYYLLHDERGFDLLQQYHKRAIGTAKSLTLLGIYQSLNEEYLACEQTMTKVLALDSMTCQARYQRGYARYQMNDQNTAFEDLKWVETDRLKAAYKRGEKQTDLDGADWALVYYSLGEIYESRDSLEAALWYFDLAETEYKRFGLYSSELEGLYTAWKMGNLYLRQGKPQKAIEAYRRHLQDYHKSDLVCAQLMRAYLDCGELKKAQQQERKVLRQLKHNSGFEVRFEVLGALGEGRLAKGNLEQAEDYLGRALLALQSYLECGFYYGRLHYAKAQLLLQQKKYAAAENYRQEAGFYGFDLARLTQLKAAIEQQQQQSE
jgi:predicted Zn-dependent protease